MPFWMTALLSLLLFALGLGGFLWRRRSFSGAIGLLLMMQGDLLFIVATVAHLADLSTQAALLLLFGLLPVEAVAGWLLWRRLGGSAD